MSTRQRWTLSAGCAALGMILLCLLLLSLWSNRVLLNEERFSARVAGTLQQDEMNRYLSGELTEQLLVRAPELITIRPAVEAVLSETLRTRTAIVGARAALRSAHQGIRAGTASEAVVLDLQAVFTLASALMQRGAPEFAARFAAGLDATRIDATAIGLETTLVERLDRLAALRIPLAAAIGALFVTAVTLAPRRERGLLIVAGGTGLAGVLGLLGEQIAEGALLATLPDHADTRGAVALVWRNLLQEYRGWNLGLIALGLSSTVGVIALLRPDDRYFRRALSQSGWGRIVAGALLATFGAAMIRWPLDAVRLLAISVGIVLGGGGVVILLRNSLATIRQRLHLIPARTALVGYALVTTVVTVTVASVMGIWFVSAAPPPPPDLEAAAITVCNGQESFCDRHLDQLTFAGTHNSMAAAAGRGWFFPSQRYGIAQQLQDGVRAFLVDTYYGFASPRGIRTDIDPDIRRPQLVAEHGEEVVAAAERIAASLAPEGGERGIYLCHSFCELGATPFASALIDIRDFLNANPGEFVILVLQDSTSPEDTVAEFELADLAGRAYAHVPGEPWPTLGELLTEGKQLLVLAEEQAGAADWYQPAFSVFQETDFNALTAAALDCRAGRGDASNPLMLQNQWLTSRPPLPAKALEVNALDAIVGRARRCAEERGRFPTVVAVDFYDVGDLLTAVDVLNGVEGVEGVEGEDTEGLLSPSATP